MYYGGVIIGESYPWLWIGSTQREAFLSILDGNDVLGHHKNIITSFEIENPKIVAVVHDQGSYVHVSGELLEEELEEELGWESVHCAAHKLQLCIQEGLGNQTIAHTLSAVRNWLVTLGIVL